MRGRSSYPEPGIAPPPSTNIRGQSGIEAWARGNSRLEFQYSSYLVVLVLIAEANCDFPSRYIIILSTLPPEREAMIAQ
jgi:hypothetical protein